MLKEQLSRKNDQYRTLEDVRTNLEKTRDEQTRQISQLQELCSTEKEHNDALLKEIDACKGDVMTIRAEKEQI